LCAVPVATLCVFVAFSFHVRWKKRPRRCADVWEMMFSTWKGLCEMGLRVCGLDVCGVLKRKSINAVEQLFHFHTPRGEQKQSWNCERRDQWLSLLSKDYTGCKKKESDVSTVCKHHFTLKESNASKRVSFHGIFSDFTTCCKMNGFVTRRYVQVVPTSSIKWQTRCPSLTKVQNFVNF
jgi:hypothetical protein